MKSFVLVLCLFWCSSVSAQCSNGSCSYNGPRPVRNIVHAVVHNRYHEVRRPVRNSVRYFAAHRPVRNTVRFFVVRRPVRTFLFGCR